MSPVDVGDSVLVEAVNLALVAVSHDLHLAQQQGREIVPDNFVGAYRYAGRVLADRCFLALDCTAGKEVKTPAQIADFERATCTRLVIRIDWAFQDSMFIRPEWVEAGAAELHRAFHTRMDERRAGPTGGAA